MINIDIEKCIGCELCIKDCLCNNIKIIDGKAQTFKPHCRWSTAASNMEIMANSLNLGVCFNGYFTYASEDINIRNYLFIPDNKKVVASLLIGYTDNKYLRTVPRKKAEIQWM